jgi:hypothetical protein
MKFVLVGSVYPYRGGIAHHLTVESVEIIQENQQITLPMPEEIP